MVSKKIFNSEIMKLSNRINKLESEIREIKYTLTNKGEHIYNTINNSVLLSQRKSKKKKGVSTSSLNSGLSNVGRRTISENSRSLSPKLSRSNSYILPQIKKEPPIYVYQDPSSAKNQTME